VSGQIWPFLAVFIPKSSNLAIFGFNYPQHWVVLGYTVSREGRLNAKHENEIIFLGILKYGREPQISKFMTKVGWSELLVLNFWLHLRYSFDHVHDGATEAQKDMGYIHGTYYSLHAFPRFDDEVGCFLNSFHFHANITESW